MSDYVNIFNTLVQEAQGLGLTQFKPVKRFADNTTAAKRIDTLQREVAKAKGETILGNGNGNGKIKKPRKVADSSSSLEIQILGARSSGTKKAKLLAHLITHENEAQKTSTLVKQVYGNNSKESNGAFKMVLGGLIKTIAEKSPDYEIERLKDDESKEVSYVFRPKG